ncbi:MAG: YjbQ family protein [Hungatella sp.]|nr:YjbQ family protein [Hungatella sp.]
MIERKKVVINTEKQFTPLDHIISEFIKGKKGAGMVNVFVAHTTCAIKVMEGEILLLSDVNTYLDKTFPMDKRYMHNIIEIRDVPINERINGHSHMRQLFFGTDVNIPVQDGKMLLGQWQTVFLIEFDPVRDRDVYITYMD